MPESKVLTPEEYALWEKAFLARLSRKGYSVTESVNDADRALVEMRARNPKFHGGSPYRERATP